MIFIITVKCVQFHKVIDHWKEYKISSDLLTCETINNIKAFRSVPCIDQFSCHILLVAASLTAKIAIFYGKFLRT